MERRRAGAGVVVAGLVVAGFGPARALDGSGGSGGRPGLGAAAPACTATAGTPGSAPTAVPAPDDPSPSAGPPSPDGDSGAKASFGIRLPAGSALSLRERPPVVRRGAYSGVFGFTAAADAFTVDGHRGRLALLPDGLPATRDACLRAAGPAVVPIPRQDVEATGVRVCVRAVDGTIAVVTLRRITLPGARDAYAVLDVVVWRVLDRHAEIDQNDVVPAHSGATSAGNSSRIRPSVWRRAAESR